MKRYFLLSVFSITTLGTFVSCDRSPEVIQTNNNIDEVFPRIKDATGSFGKGNNYALDMDINIPKTDVVLVYRNVNSNTSDAAVWQLLPQTIYLSDNRELDYTFRFNTQRIQVTTSSNFDYSTLTRQEEEEYLRNQTFRVVLVPALNGRSSKLNYSDYHNVIKYYNLDDNNVRSN